MFWCAVCKCAYPHGPEGPGAALEAHSAAQHGGGSPSDGARTITGGQVVIGLVVLVVLAWVMRVFA